MGFVLGCAFSPDGRRLVSGSHDHTLKLWDAKTGACEATLQGHHGWVSGCAFSPDARFIISGSWDQTLKVWDSDTTREVLGMPMAYPLLCVAVHANRPRLAFGDDAGIVSLVEVHGLEWAGGVEGAAGEVSRTVTPPDPTHAAERGERRGWRRVLPFGRS